MASPSGPVVATSFTSRAHNPLRPAQTIVRAAEPSLQAGDRRRRRGQRRSGFGCGTSGPAARPPAAPRRRRGHVNAAARMRVPLPGQPAKPRGTAASHAPLPVEAPLRVGGSADRIRDSCLARPVGPRCGLQHAMRLVRRRDHDVAVARRRATRTADRPERTLLRRCLASSARCGIGCRRSIGLRWYSPSLPSLHLR